MHEVTLVHALQARRDLAGELQQQTLLVKRLSSDLVASQIRFQVSLKHTKKLKLQQGNTILCNVFLPLSVDC